MRKSLAAIALFTGLQAQGQDTHKWQLIVNLQPELTFHRNNYSIIWSPRTIDTITRVSMSYGAGAAIKYKVSKICFSRWEQILFSEI